MFQVKVLRRQQADKSATSMPTQGQGSADTLTAAILTVLGKDIQARPSVTGAVTTAVTSWVASEVKFAGSAGPERDAFVGVATAILRTILAGLTEERDTGVLHIMVPLITRLSAQQVVQDVVTALIRRHGDGRRQLGGKAAEIATRNLCRVSKLTEQQARERPYRVKFPKDVEATDTELVQQFLGGTAIGQLLLSPVAVTITDRVRLSHGVCIAGSGAGKSQLLGAIVAAELARPKHQETGLLVLDSQTDLVTKLSRVQALAGGDRLVLADAGDSQALAVNLFDWGGGSLQALPQAERDQALLTRIELTEYVISGLFGSEFTVRQQTLLRYLIQLVLSIPGATLETLRQILEEPELFRGDIEKLDGLAREYLVNQFMSKGFAPVRKQVVQRLYAVLQSGTFARMVTAKTNKLRIGEALDAGKIVLVNTSKQVLGEQSRVFGRFIISLLLRAAFERAKQPEASRRPAYVLIDEASDYFSDEDKTLQTLLEQARKYSIGCMLFTQNLSQLPTGLRSAVMSNCAIKLAANVSARDAKLLAADMQCSPEFILAQHKAPDAANFAAHVRDITPRGVSWRVPLFQVERMPGLSDAGYAAMRARQRRELCA